METAEKLIEIAERQRKLVTELEQEVKAFDEFALAREQKRLKADLEKVTVELEDAKRKLCEISDENTGLKNRLFEQTFQEKAAILNNITEKMDIYFRSGLEGEANALRQLEFSVRVRIEKLNMTLQQERVDSQDEIHQKLGEVTALLDEKLVKLRLHYQLEHQAGPYSPEEQEELRRLKEAQITDEQMKLLAKKNNIESLVGLSILNKLGIFLILVGVIAASRYTYLRLPDLLKGIMMFVLGGAMLLGGELQNQKKANVFSLGITAGGVSMLYIALSISYFGLQIVNMYAALVLCVLITATAFLLSTRYKSQTILSFALIGGYLPIFSIGGGSLVLYAVVIYFVALNLLALLISFKRKWTVSTFIGLFLNLGGTICICVISFLNKLPFHQLLLIGYLMFTFVVYTLIPVLGTYKEKGRFNIRDVVLIAINTLFSSGMMYLLFFAFGWEDYDGALTVFFALIYLLMGRLIETKFSKEKNMTGLFYLTGFTFVVLTIPLQLGMVWLSMGWLVEGTALLIYGIMNKEKVFRWAGIAICGLCLLSFLLVDVIGFWIFPFSSFFPYKYLAVTLGSAAILGALIYQKELYTRPARIYKYGVVVNLWIYMQYVIYNRLGLYLFEHVTEGIFNLSYLIGALAVVCTLLFAYAIPRLRILTDTGMKVISLVLYLMGIVTLLVLNIGSISVSEGLTRSVGTFVIGTVILLVLSLLSLLALNDIVRYFVLKQALPIAFYPLIISGYFVVVLTQLLICQYQLSFSSAAISIIYAVTAFAWIVMGFVRRYSFLRRFGLGLAILAVGKLFLVDLYSLTQEYKIVSYFVLGALLLAISFVYQYFSKRLESGKEEVSDVEKNR